jgi:hypothetical protein
MTRPSSKIWVMPTFRPSNVFLPAFTALTLIGYDLVQKIRVC